jgi:large subunit ribosomal protein LP2
MRYVAAYLLAVLGGHKNPSADLITGILQAGGIEVDQEKVKFLLKELEGKDIAEGMFQFEVFIIIFILSSHPLVLKAGQEKMSKVAAAGPAQAATTTASTTAAPSGGDKKPDAPAPKKEKTPEPSEEEGADGLMDFF